MLRRPHLGTYGALLGDLRSNDEMAYRNFCRMDAASYQELLTLVTPAISKLCGSLRFRVMSFSACFQFCLGSLWSKKATCASTQASLISMNFRQIIVTVFGDYSMGYNLSPFSATFVASVDRQSQAIRSSALRFRGRFRLAGIDRRLYSRRKRRPDPSVSMSLLLSRRIIIIQSVTVSWCRCRQINHSLFLRQCCTLQSTPSHRPVFC